MLNNLDNLASISLVDRLGEVTKYSGLTIEATGPAKAFIGEVCDVMSANNEFLMKAEVIGFADNKVTLMPYGASQGLHKGCQIKASQQRLTLPVGPHYLGRVIDPFGQPLDGLGPIHCVDHTITHKAPSNPLERERITDVMETKIHCIDALLTLGVGQRVGVFAGSGVGKSHLLGQMAQHITTDVKIIALIGERGREVNDFLINYLGRVGLQKSVVIVATADQPALIRKLAAYSAITLAEYFCAQGGNVVMMLDSITRLTMAQREIGLALGEPPTARGYTPSVFSILPGLIERAGNFKRRGSISAIYTVLVEGDDFNEPIADTMRSLLDGHIVLTREKAQRGHYPAIDVLQSISRLSTQLQTREEMLLTQSILRTLQHYESAKDMIDIGMHKSGNNLDLDLSILRTKKINKILTSSIKQNLSRNEVTKKFYKIMETTA